MRSLTGCCVWNMWSPCFTPFHTIIHVIFHFLFLPCRPLRLVARAVRPLRLVARAVPDSSTPSLKRLQRFGHVNFYAHYWTTSQRLQFFHHGHLLTSLDIFWHLVKSFHILTSLSTCNLDSSIHDPAISNIRSGSCPLRVIIRNSTNAGATSGIDISVPVGAALPPAFPMGRWQVLWGSDGSTWTILDNLGHIGASGASGGGCAYLRLKSAKEEELKSDCDRPQQKARQVPSQACRSQMFLYDFMWFHWPANSWPEERTASRARYVISLPLSSKFCKQRMLCFLVFRDLSICCKGMWQFCKGEAKPSPPVQKTHATSALRVATPIHFSTRHYKTQHCSIFSPTMRFKWGSEISALNRRRIRILSR